jgi:superkiller protein 3
MRAVTLLTAGLEREPQNKQAWSLLAAANWELRNRTAAAESARRAVELAPEDTFARRILAQALAESGHGDEALEQTRALLELEPGELKTMEAAAFQLIAAGFEHEALEIADRAVELFPNRFEAHNARGWAAQSLGEFAQAQAHLEQAVALKSISMTHNNLGWVLLKIGKVDLALARFDEALALDPNNFYAAGNRPLALRLLGRRDEAAQAWRINQTAWLEKYEQALEVDPQDPDALSYRSRRLLSLGREREAVEAAREAASRLPDDPVIRRSLTIVELASGNPRAAATAADVALELDHASFAALEFAAWYGACADSELERAATTAKKALAQRPDGTRAWAAAGHGEIAEGNYAESVAWFEKVIRRWPLDCCAFAGRGLAQFMNGAATQAEDDLGHALLLSNDRCVDALLLKARLAAAAA